MTEREDKQPQATMSSHVDHDVVPTENGNPTGAQRAAGEVQLDRLLGPPHAGPSALLREHFDQKPLSYQQYFERRNEAERTFAEVIPQVAAFLNERAATLITDEAERFEIDDTEISLTWLAEGGDKILVKNDPSYSQYAGLASFTDLVGAGHAVRAAGPDHAQDSFAAQEAAKLPRLQRDFERSAKAWCHPSVIAFLEAPGNRTMSWAEQLYGIGAYYAAAKAKLAHDLHHTLGVSIGELPKTDVYFWVTIYFNSGPTGGRARLRKHGTSPAATSWKKYTGRGPDGERKWHEGNPYWQALRRAAAFEQLDPEPDGPAPNRSAR
jgi:hypothetical protein